MDYTQLAKLSDEQLITELVRYSMRGATAIDTESALRKIQIISDEALLRMKTRRPGRPTKQ